MMMYYYYCDYYHMIYQVYQFLINSILYEVEKFLYLYFLVNHMKLKVRMLMLMLVMVVTGLVDPMDPVVVVGGVINSSTLADLVFKSLSIDLFSFYNHVSIY